MSVGLGNLWRFPFKAYQNGGGAFLIPYVICFYIIGKPGHFLEMVMGQFSSKGTIKIYDCVPAMRGVGIGQLLAMIYVLTYYSSIMGLTLKYLFSSFTLGNLPWTECLPEWENCYSASHNSNQTIVNNASKSSADLYFSQTVYNKITLNEGIGHMNWDLVACIAVAWFIVFIILVKGVKSSGKFSYFLAIFPYLMLITLLVKTLTLPGSIDGVKEFFTPKWEKLIEPEVWYEAVTQVFFSLNVYFAMCIVYSSYNKFNHKVHIDSNIITAVDTLTSILAGCCVFACLGHLKHELGIDDLAKVVKGGPELTFISYPEAISKFSSFSTIFSIAFFFMLFTLGIGSNVAMTTCVVTEIKDYFKGVKDWQASLVVAVLGTCCGSIYYLQSGLNILDLVDYYGANLVMFNLAVFELITFCYIYGVDKICRDVKFMLKFDPGMYWRFCWKFLTPSFLLFIVLYNYYEMLFGKNEQKFPDEAKYVGYLLTFSGLCQLPFFMVYEIVRSKGDSWKEKFTNAFKPLKTWGPRDLQDNLTYQEFLLNNNNNNNSTA